MKLTRIFDVTSNQYYYIDQLGKKVPQNFQVFVDGKRMVVDFSELDTEEGWVDMEMPRLKEVSVVKEGSVCEPLELAPSFTIERKRVQGDVKVVVLADDGVGK